VVAPDVASAEVASPEVASLDVKSLDVKGIALILLKIFGRPQAFAHASGTRSGAIANREGFSV
jgi:hypothetical protein